MMIKTFKEEFLMIRSRGQKYRVYNQLFGTGVMIILLMVLGCATVPLTERKTLRLISDSELATLSFQQYTEVLKKSKLSNDPGKVHLVKRVGERIARASEAFMKDSGMEADIKNYKWEFNLIEDDQVANAWCMPGGKVAVYTGILPITHDESGLAVVMGHEIAHAIANHGNERMSELFWSNLEGQAFLSPFLRNQPSRIKSLWRPTGWGPM